MSDNESSIPSPTLSKLSTSGTTNTLFTPCRTVGLKRKSTGTLTPKTISKKIKFIDDTSKSTEVAENVTTLNVKAEDDSILELEYDDETLLLLEKRRIIEDLISELKNSEQHNLDQLEKVTKKWLSACQGAVTSMFNKINEKGNSNIKTIEDLIRHLGICPDVIQFDSNTQEFY